MTPVSTLKWSDLVKRPFELTAFTVTKEIPLPATRRPTIQFAEPDQVSGMAGVNRYGLRAKFGEGHTIVWITPPIATRMAGPPEAMALEGQFLKALPEMKYIELVGDELRFRNAESNTYLIFKRNP
ncbi:MAG: META domain-containing protein [Acidobacteria bacterium]|nr:META domain-containing protein [Acidobacteriota bacterium]